MDAGLQTHLDRIRQSATTDELREAMLGAAALYDLHSFTYYILQGDQPSRSLLSASFPSAWIDRYFAAEHFRVDPLMATLRKAVQPFVWGTSGALRDLTARQKQMFDEARHFGVALGFSVPVQSRLRTCFGYVSDLPEPAFLRLLEDHEDELCLAAHYFHERAAKLLLDWVPDVREVLRRVVDQTRRTVESFSEHQAVAAADALLSSAAAPQGEILDALEAMARHFKGRARSADERSIIQVVVGVLEMHGRGAEFLDSQRALQ